MSTHSILLFSVIFFAAVTLILFFVLTKRRKQSGASRQAELINEQVYIGNLPYRVTEDDLETFFSRFGGIEKVKVIRHFETGRSKGYAFVTYFSSKHANKALQAHGQDLQGRAMVVRIAKPKQYQEAY